MMREFAVYAGWLNPEEKIGHCLIEQARGNEVIGFSFERNWLRKHPGLILDPDIYPVEGPQFPPSGKSCFGFLLDTSPDRWGRKLMNRREAIEAKEEKRPRRRLTESDYLLGVHDGGRTGGIRFFNDAAGVYLSNRETLAAPPMGLKLPISFASTRPRRRNTSGRSSALSGKTGKEKRIA